MSPRTFSSTGSPQVWKPAGGRAGGWASRLSSAALQNQRRMQPTPPSHPHGRGRPRCPPKPASSAAHPPTYPRRHPPAAHTAHPPTHPPVPGGTLGTGSWSWMRAQLSGTLRWKSWAKAWLPTCRHGASGGASGGQAGGSEVTGHPAVETLGRCVATHLQAGTGAARNGRADGRWAGTPARPHAGHASHPPLPPPHPAPHLPPPVRSYPPGATPPTTTRHCPARTHKASP